MSIPVTTHPLLPGPFADLEPFAAKWVLPTLEERLQERLDTSMEDLQAFYDAVYPRAEEAMAYLDQLDVKDLPETAENLMVLLFSLSVVSVATDVFFSQKDPTSGATWVYEISEPGD
jgi:hypothetical protein